MKELDVFGEIGIEDSLSGEFRLRFGEDLKQWKTE